MAETISLGDLKLFTKLSEKQVEKLAGITEKRAYETGAIVYECGEPATHLFIVDKGSVSLRELKPSGLKPGGEKGLVFETAKRGDPVGTACLMEPRQYTLTAVCLESSSFWVMEADSLLRLCEEDADLGYKLMWKIAQIYFKRYSTAKKQLYDMVDELAAITGLDA